MYSVPGTTSVSTGKLLMPVITIIIDYIIATATSSEAVPVISATTSFKSIATVFVTTTGWSYKLLV